MRILIKKVSEKESNGPIFILWKSQKREKGTERIYEEIKAEKLSKSDGGCEATNPGGFPNSVLDKTSILKRHYNQIVESRKREVSCHILGTLNDYQQISHQKL